MTEGDLLLQTITIHVGEFATNSPPVASIAAPPLAAPGQSIVLDASDSLDPDNDSLTFAWDLDNDEQFDDATGAIVRRSFSSLPQTVRVNVSDGRGGFETAQVTIGRNQPPTAQINAPSTTVVDQTITLSAGGSTDPEGGSLSYAWDLDNDGQFDDGSGQNVQHAFASGGTNRVRVRVTDPVGLVATAATTVRVNGPPEAALTASPRQAAPGDSVQLDASGSSDAEGDTLTYGWDLDNDGTVDRETSSPTLEITVDDPPQTVTVTVTDTNGLTDRARVTIAPADNNPPSAALSAPSEANLGESITLDASGSSDPEGDALTYAWDLDGDGNFETTSNVSSISTVFDSPGDQEVAVRVTDSFGDTDTAASTVSVNGPPDAALTATPDQVAPGETVELDATGSSDPNGDALTYAWDLDGDGTFETTSNTPSLPLSFEASGEHEVAVRVTDPAGLTDTAAVTIRVNGPPEAALTATPDQVAPGETVELDASASSDPEGDTLTYGWDLDNDGTVDQETSSPTLEITVDDPPQTVAVTVTDAAGQSDTASVTIGPTENNPPTAALSAPAEANQGDSVTLDASGSSDPEGDALTYAWDLDGDGTIDQETSSPTIETTVDELPRTVTVTVTDPTGQSDTASVTIAQADNNPPNAELSAPTEANVDESITLDATGSSDPEGDPLTFAWDLDGDGTFETTSNVASLPYAFETPGEHEVAVLVTDPSGLTDTAAATINVNGPPQAALSATPEQVTAGDTVELDASGSSDPEGDVLTYAWDLDGDGTIDRETSSPTLEITVDEPPQTVTVTVTDATGQSDTASVTIAQADNNPPNALLSAPDEATVGESVRLNAGGSSDPDGDPLTYAWDLNGDGTFERTSNVSSLSRVFDSPGAFEVAVQVTDGRGGLDTASATITVNPIENETQPANDTVDIEVGNETDESEPNVTVRDLDENELPSGDSQAPPQAQIDAINETIESSIEAETGGNASELRDVFGRQQTEAVQRSLRAAGAQAVTEVGRPITLSGSRSLIRSSQAVDGEGKIVKAWDITMSQAATEGPVTLRLEVPRSRFPEGSDPENARVGHFTGEGWEVLETRIVRISETAVVFEVDVTSFSPFAVFAENEVKHEWTLPNGTVIEGTNIRAQFDEVGIYNVTLTVTDAFGQSDSTDYRILVNDPPQPTIEVSGQPDPGEPVTLRANITNEVGEVTDIVWIFQDGTRVFNETVTVKFGKGRQRIRVAARDVYGAIGTSTTRLEVGDTLPEEGQSQPTAPGVPNAGAIVLVGLGAAFTFLSGRWAYPGDLAMLRPVAPRVATLEDPIWDDGVIRIHKLEVQDPNGDLERIVLTVRDADENPLLEKEIEVDPTYSYEAAPERIQAPMLRGENVADGYDVVVQGFDAEDNSSRRERHPIGS